MNRRFGVGDPGRAEEMQAAAAIDLARRARPRDPERVDADDPGGRRTGVHVGIAPDGEDPVVTGRVVCVGVEEIAIARSRSPRRRRGRGLSAGGLSQPAKAATQGP